MNEQAGKGDSYRKVDPKKWSDGWERAFGKMSRTSTSRKMLQKPEKPCINKPNS